MSATTAGEDKPGHLGTCQASSLVMSQFSGMEHFVDAPTTALSKWSKTCARASDGILYPKDRYLPDWSTARGETNVLRGTASLLDSVAVPSTRRDPRPHIAVVGSMMTVPRQPGRSSDPDRVGTPAPSGSKLSPLAAIDPSAREAVHSAHAKRDSTLDLISDTEASCIMAGVLRWLASSSLNAPPGVSGRTNENFSLAPSPCENAKMCFVDSALPLAVPSPVPPNAAHSCESVHLVSMPMSTRPVDDFACATKAIRDPGVVLAGAEANTSAPISLAAVTDTSSTPRLSRTAPASGTPENRKRCTLPECGGVNTPENRSTQSFKV